MQSVIERLRTAASAAVLGTLLAAGLAQAVVYSGPVSLAIPNTAAGRYVNDLKGGNFSGPGTFPVLGGPGTDHDFNIFGTAAFTFFSPSDTGQSLPTVLLTPRGYVTATATVAALNLAAGTLIGGSSIFNTGSPSASALTTGAPAISPASRPVSCPSRPPGC